MQVSRCHVPVRQRTCPAEAGSAEDCPRPELAVATIARRSGRLFLPGQLPKVGGRAHVGRPETLGTPDTSLDEGRLPDYSSCHSQSRMLTP
jgi:hypothetical protein